MSDIALVHMPPPPSNLEAEQAILGAVLFDNRTMAALSGTLTGTHFHEPYHGRLFDLMAERIADGRLADPTMLRDKLADDPAFATNGGLRYLADLMDNAPAPHIAGAYAAPILEAAARRRLIEVGAHIATTARATDYDAMTIASEAARELEQVIAGAAPNDGTMIDARDAAAELVNELDHEAEHGVSPGLLTGIDCIDAALGGLFPNELIILGGRPSMGKTALARAIAFAVARRYPDRLVPIFALEMDRRQISRRNLSALSWVHGRGIQYRDMKRGRDLSSEDRAHLSDMKDRVPRNLILDDTAVLTLDHVRRRLLSLSKRGSIGLVVIDYLQIMDMPNLGAGMNLTTALGLITKGLKQLSKQLGCTILLLSQLSRKVEDRDNKRPTLSDLRESGSIEQDASIVLFAYRDAYYLEREGPRRGQSREEHELALQGSMRTMEVICGKSREGPVGITRQTYYAECDVIQNEDRH